MRCMSKSQFDAENAQPIDILKSLGKAAPKDFPRNIWTQEYAREVVTSRLPPIFKTSMIKARCIPRPSHSLGNAHRLVISSSRLARNVIIHCTSWSYSADDPSQFSSSGFIDRSRRARVTSTLPSRSQSLFLLQQWQPARFASTATDAPPIADIQDDFAPPTTSPISSGEAVLSTTLDDVTSSLPVPNYEHLGFLKEMGLDYGWGPTALIETLLEHVHIYAGTPWWASIGLSVIIVRICLLKLYFDAADMSARNQLIAQHQAPITERLKAAQATRNAAGMQKALKEIKDLRASAGVKYYKMFLPFIQVPLGYGTFRLMRGMAYMPVPGLETGGVLWMNDLTLSDPYFLLPVMTAASYYLSFKVNEGSQNMRSVC